MTIKFDSNHEPSELEQAFILAGLALLNDQQAVPMNVHIVKIPSHDDTSNGILQVSIAFVMPEKEIMKVEPAIKKFVEKILPSVTKMQQVRRH